MGAGASLSSIRKTLSDAKAEIVREFAAGNVDQARFLAQIACEQASNLEEILHKLHCGELSEDAKQVALDYCEITKVIGEHSKDYIKSCIMATSLFLLLGKSAENELEDYIYYCTEISANHNEPLANSLINLYAYNRIYEVDCSDVKEQFLQVLAKNDQVANISEQFTTGRLLYRVQMIEDIYKDANLESVVSSFASFARQLIENKEDLHSNSASHTQSCPSLSAPSRLTINTNFNEANTEGVWMDAIDEASGHIYYYNSVTNETTWEMPEAYRQQQINEYNVASPANKSPKTPQFNVVSPKGEVSEFQQTVILIHNEQRDRVNAMAEFIKVRKQLSELERLFKYGEESEQSIAQATKVGELSDARESLEARLRGCNKELKRLVTVLKHLDDLDTDERDKAEYEVSTEANMKRVAKAQLLELEEQIKQADELALNKHKMSGLSADLHKEQANYNDALTRLKAVQLEILKLTAQVGALADDSSEAAVTAGRRLEELKQLEAELEGLIADNEGEMAALSAQLAAITREKNVMNDELDVLRMRFENEQKHRTKAKLESSQLKAKLKGLEDQARLDKIKLQMKLNEDAKAKAGLLVEKQRLEEQLLAFKQQQQQLDSDKARADKEAADGLDFLAKQKARAEERLLAEQRDKQRVELELVRLKTELEAKAGEEELQRQRELAAREAELAAKLEQLQASQQAMEADKQRLYEEFVKEQQLRKQYFNEIEDLKGKIRVFCRIRPMSDSELERGCQSVVRVDPEDKQQIVLVKPGKRGRAAEEVTFRFDTCFDADASQEEVFGDVLNLVQTAVDGYNVCMFTYGQTGSGKTYTLSGPSLDAGGDGNADAIQPSAGICQRAVWEIFRLLDRDASRFEFDTSIYIIEQHRENMLDLLWRPAEGGEEKDLAKQNLPPVLSVHLDANGVVEVDNITVSSVSSYRETLAVIESAWQRRHVTATDMNKSSSRSHLVTSIIIKAKAVKTGVVTVGKLTLVDLAGSERASKTGASGDTLQEAKSINSSLLALGDVIQALTTKAKHVPYRNHPLTQLMADSLGGNAKTLMFVNVSPADFNVSESKESLRWATRVKQVSNTSTKGIETAQIKALKEQVKKLQAASTPTNAGGAKTRVNAMNAFAAARKLKVGSSK